LLGARILTAVALLAALFAALWWLPRSGLAVLGALVISLAGWEWGRLCRLGRGAAAFFAAALGAAVALGTWALEAHGAGALALWSVAGLLWALVVPWWMWRGVRAAHAPALMAAGVVVLVPAGIAFVWLSTAQLLAVFGLIWLCDTAAYAAGRAFGRHRLAPGISPGKTWEGVLGALFAAMAYALAYAALAPHPALVERDVLWTGTLFGALALLAAGIIGDLFESALKRQAQVKDSGALLPGHGGILDRIDSATASLPIAALLWHGIAPR
jgi:phosphatidate cytidylyltransferase